MSRPTPSQPEATISTSSHWLASGPGVLVLRYWACPVGTGRGSGSGTIVTVHVYDPTTVTIVSGDPTKLKLGTLLVLGFIIVYKARWTIQLHGSDTVTDR